MKSQMALLSLGIVLFSSLASASLDLYPSEFNFNLSSGENKTENITFISDGIYLINLDYIIENNISPIKIQIINESALIVNKNTTFPITIISDLGNSAEPFDIKLRGYIENTESQVIIQEIPVYYGGGGSWSVKNVSKNESIPIIQKNETPKTIKEIIKELPIAPTTQEQKIGGIIVIIGVILFIAFVLFDKFILPKIRVPTNIASQGGDWKNKDN